ncbi:MAG: hypothetical protein HQ474_03715, partial [Flammeovirgaceae bacterium]|nr:hypothetical protein [Flammeovirgaceae bacterium]
MVKSSISKVPFAISSRVADSLANGEYDPIFRQSVASGITSDDIVRWNGDITETEPSPPFNLELPNGKIYLGDGTNQAAEVTMSGDVTIDNAGATAIGASKVLTGNILDGTIVVGDLANAA